MKILSRTWCSRRIPSRPSSPSPPDPFIVLTSNIFAILGSRALYFLLADVADRFHLLKYCLAMVLTFIGTKMLIAPLNHVPVVASRATIVVLIGASVVASLIVTRGGHPVVRHVRAHT